MGVADEAEDYLADSTRFFPQGELKPFEIHVAPTLSPEQGPGVRILISQDGHDDIELFPDVDFADGLADCLRRKAQAARDLTTDLQPPPQTP